MRAQCHVAARRWEETRAELAAVRGLLIFPKVFGRERRIQESIPRTAASQDGE